MRVMLVTNMFPARSDLARGVFVRNAAAGLRSLGVRIDPVVAIRGRPGGRLGRVLAYARFWLAILMEGVMRSRADWLWLHYPTHAAPPVALVWLFTRVRLCLNYHGSDLRGTTGIHRLLAPASHWLSRRATAIVVPSAALRDEAIARLGVDPARVHVSPSGGLDLDLLVPRDRVESRRALDLDASAFVVGFVGRPVLAKGIDTFLDAVATLRAGSEAVRGVVVGPPSSRGVELTLAIAERGLEDVVSVVGAVPQAVLPDVYAAMDVLAFPSRAESLGLVPLEALACGTPVVASDLPALREVIVSGETGERVPVGDAEALAKALARLRDVPARCAEMGAAGRERVQMFERGAVAQRLLEVFVQV